MWREEGKEGERDGEEDRWCVREKNKQNEQVDYHYGRQWELL